MLCDTILGNVSNKDADWGGQDLVDVTWQECARRALHKQSRSGRDVKILLPLGARLRHGDVLFVDPRGCVVVNVPPCEVLVVQGVSLRELGLLALELGNLHVPTEIGADGEIVALGDGPVEALFARYGIAYERQTRRFAPLPVDVAPHLRLADNFRVLHSLQTSSYPK